MCGIFGCLLSQRYDRSFATYFYYVKMLQILSASRGKESSGIAVMTSKNEKVLKKPCSSKKLTASKEYKRILMNCFLNRNNGYLASLGHARLITDGKSINNNNNHPVEKRYLKVIHNGIIVNADDIFQNNDRLKRSFEVDTEVINELFHLYESEGSNFIDNIIKIFYNIKGSASIILHKNYDNKIIIATNTGSIYYSPDEMGLMMLIASERHILHSIRRKKNSQKYLYFPQIRQLKPNRGSIIDLESLGIEEFELKSPIYSGTHTPGKPSESLALFRTDAKIKKKLSAIYDNEPALRRCTKCILPETIPFIKFDESGVCNFCRGYQKVEPLGEVELNARVAPFRKKTGEPDCLVAFSGGRDSSFMLHYVKKVLKMNPVAYTYDWGMVTDLARRNQARMCGKLGVEHIIVSADINKKREYIRKNIQAWLKRPELGMIPLFMAGDKHFFYHNISLMKKTNTNIVFWGTNPLELCVFKTGFAGADSGVWHDFYGSNSVSRQSKLISQLLLSGYYVKQYFLNPHYINASLIDSASAFLCSLLFPVVKKMLMFFNYVYFDEQNMLKILKNDYEWESDSDTSATWRIGDGTASFYNLIYLSVAGFTEHDTFRSNQIRAGLINREKALEIVKKENKIRPDSLIWYAKTIGFDLSHAIDVINKIPSLYDNSIR